VYIYSRIYGVYIFENIRCIYIREYTVYRYSRIYGVYIFENIRCIYIREYTVPPIKTSSPTLVTHPVSYSTDSGGPLLEVQRPGSNVHSPPCSVGIKKNEWSFTSTAFMEQVWTALSFDEYVNRTTYSGFAHNWSDGSCLQFSITVMRGLLTTGIRSEKCVVRRFRRHVNVIQRTDTNLDSTV